VIFDFLHNTVQVFLLQKVFEDEAQISDHDFFDFPIFGGEKEL
jgi:hypothetical protein